MIVGTRKAIALRLRVTAGVIGQSRDDCLKGHGHGHDDKGEVNEEVYQAVRDNPDRDCKRRGLPRDCRDSY